MGRIIKQLERTLPQPSAEPPLVLTLVRLDDVIKAKAMNVLAKQFDKPHIQQAYQIGGKPAFVLFLKTADGSNEIVTFWSRGIINEVLSWVSSSSIPEVVGNNIHTSEGNVKVIVDMIGAKAVNFAKDPT